MAGTMVHLMVAEKLKNELLQREWSYPFENSSPMIPDYFIAGNICPDGIMARKDYQRQMKLHTHFRDGIPDGSFDKPGMAALFEKRMKQFWEAHLLDERECPGLYLGYITHMMTDEKFILEERPKFFQNIAVLGLTCQDRETFIYFNRETDLVDYKLLREHKELQQAREALERVPAYEIRGLITESELLESKKWILAHFFEEEHSSDEPQFLEYDSMEVFINSVVKEIMERLFTEGYLVNRNKREGVVK